MLNFHEDNFPKSRIKYIFLDFGYYYFLFLLFFNLFEEGKCDLDIFLTGFMMCVVLFYYNK